MASLFTYMKDVQRLLADKKQGYVGASEQVAFINTARRKVAMDAMCCRQLTNSSNACTTATILTPGSGFTSVPTITISAPDFPSGVLPYPNGLQATAVGMVSGGQLLDVFITQGGAGYFQPTATVSGGGGTGATVAIQVSPINVLLQGQEDYPFANIDMTNFPGALSVYAVFDASIIYSNYRYPCPVIPFSDYQAYVRQYPFQYQYVPSFATQFGQGASGNLKFYPIPSQTLQFELDCLVLPQDLTTDLSVELIPDPWTDAVKFYTLHLCYLSLQNHNVARMYLDLYKAELLSYSVAARPSQRRYRNRWRL